MPSFKEWLFGSPDKQTKLPTGTPEQEALHGDILGQLKQMLESGGGYNLAQNYNNNLLQPGQEGFNQFAQPYMQEFEQKLLPQIAERFAGQGALSSSGFGQAIGGAASDFQSKLAQLFTSLQQQAAQSNLNQFNQMSNTGLNYEPFTYKNQQGNQGILGTLGTGFLNKFGGGFGNAAASGIVNLFSKKDSEGGLLG